VDRLGARRMIQDRDETIPGHILDLETGAAKGEALVGRQH
jgi:hypothetical protein